LLFLCSVCPYGGRARGSGGRRWFLVEPREESPGSSEDRCRVTPGGGDPRDSATESRPPCFGMVRAKGCGKSAPRDRQRNRHGKPHREQDRIGTARFARSRHSSCPVVRVGCLRVMATSPLEEWSPIARKRVDRTRLTDPLAFSSMVFGREAIRRIFRPAQDIGCGTAFLCGEDGVSCRCDS